MRGERGTQDGQLPKVNVAAVHVRKGLAGRCAEDLVVEDWM